MIQRKRGAFWERVTMRNALLLMLASFVAALVISGIWFWSSSPRLELAAPNTISSPAAERLAASSPGQQASRRADVEVTAAIPDQPAAATKQPNTACANSDGLGVSRVVEVDTTGGPGFGFQNFKQLDFLTDKEVVLTFDDGPWPGNTPAVLKALADECTTGIFFTIGKHATYYPDVLKQVAAAGHTIGTHTWSHTNLNKKTMTEQQQKDEIEKGVSAIAWALGTPPAPFFRFPELQHPPGMVTYLGDRDRKSTRLNS